MTATGTTKYGGQGNFKENVFSRFNLTKNRKNLLTNLVNHSLAKSTWSSYKTAERLLAMCRKDEGRRMELPMTEEDIIIFIGWLIEVRNVKAATINCYLSGIRQLHTAKGIEIPNIRTELVRSIMTGKKNLDGISSRKGKEPQRLPITMTMMRLLKNQIRKWIVPLEQRLLMWAVCSLAFHGAFRISELLSKSAVQFDPDFVLLTDDITIKEEGKEKGAKFLEVKLKCPKENKVGKAVLIEVYESGGTLCPVKAFERWRNMTNSEAGLPVFREADGALLTATKFNKWLRNRLEEHIDYRKGKFTSHSFRIGLATTLGTKGFSDDDVKEAGRWNSNTYEIYMRLPRSKRLDVAKRIGELEKN